MTEDLWLERVVAHLEEAEDHLGSAVADTSRAGLTAGEGATLESLLGSVRTLLRSLRSRLRSAEGADVR